MTVNLLGLDQEALAAYCAGLGEKPFRARQLLRWIHQVGVDDFGAMTDMSKALRERLAHAHHHDVADGPVFGHATAEASHGALRRPCPALQGIARSNSA